MTPWSGPKYSRIQMVALLAAAVFLTSLVWRFVGAQRSDGLHTVPHGADLKEAIENLRAELEEAATSRHDSSQPAVFELSTVDVELDVVAKTTDSATGKLEYQVVTAEMKHEIGSELTHKVTLHLSPLPEVLLTNQTEDKTLDSSDAIKE
jgi:hypothetical protein